MTNIKLNLSVNKNLIEQWSIKHDLQNANSDRQPIVTPCPYCHNPPRQKNLILTPTEDSFIRIVYMDVNKLVLEDRNMIKKVKINYCPMCGRKLLRYQGQRRCIHQRGRH